MANLHSYPLAIPRETERRTVRYDHPKKELQLRPAVDSHVRSHGMDSPFPNERDKGQFPKIEESKESPTLLVFASPPVCHGAPNAAAPYRSHIQQPAITP